LTKPNFFIIGAQRAGSTTIHNALKAHPEIFMSDIKEPQYFVAQMLLEKAQSNAVNRAEYEIYLTKGKYRTPEAYFSLFHISVGFKIIGESSHYIYRPETASIIYKECPNSKILISVRNPIDRFFSEYQLAKRTGNYFKRFEDYYLENVNSVGGKNKLDKGFYANKIRHFIDVFGMENVKVIIFDDFKKHPQETLKAVLQWLGVNHNLELPIVNVQLGGTIKNKYLAYFMKHKGINKMLKGLIANVNFRHNLRQMVYKKAVKPEKIDFKTWQELLVFYESEIADLELLLNKSLNSWRTYNP
jgi:hypothetical protein